MRQLFGIVLLINALVVNTPAEVPVITVTNQNLAFVRESRTVEVKSGIGEYQLSGFPALMDPASCQFYSSTDGFRLIYYVFDSDLTGVDHLLQRAVNSTLSVFSDQGQARGKLLAFDSGYLYLETSDGILNAIPRSAQNRIAFDELGKNYTSVPTLRVKAAGTGSGDTDIRISYLTRGMDWTAYYTALYDEASSTVDLSARVSVDNRSGKSFQQTRLRLLSGSLHEAGGGGGAPRMQKMMEAVGMSAAPGEAESISEYKLFDLPQPVDLPDQQTSLISFIKPGKLKVTKQFIYDYQIDSDGVSVSLIGINDKSSGPGTPLPEGIVNIYNMGDQTEYIGSDNMPRIPVGEKITIRIGQAYDVKAERKILEQKKLSGRSEQMTVQVELRNHKDEAIEILVNETVPSYRSYEIIRSGYPVAEHNARSFNFKIPVSANKTETLTYTILYTW
jgi:hypothetical protein